MGIAVLGPLQVDGQVNGLSPRDRVVLSALVVRVGEPMSTEVLADVLWGESLPASWAKVVHGCVMRLRKQLGGAAIESGPLGYRLTLHDDELDHVTFQRLLERAREALEGGDPTRSSYLVQEALDLWRGRALSDLEEWEPGRVEGARLEGLRVEAEELRVAAEISAGHASAVLEQARALVAQAPFRERRWALLATALYQAGRQSEALGALQRARTMLVEELGLDPSPDLIEIEQKLLRQDPSLTPPAGLTVSDVCPYRGLLPYDADDADSFFGREQDVAACLRRLRESGVLAVIGPSGIGKSSLVRAGVVASLMHGGAEVLLTTPGAHPMDSLGRLRTRGRQTLVVDQAEEAVTVCTDPAERERYFAALAAHASADGALVMSLRSDHLGDLAPYPDVARLLEEGLYLLGPMDESELRAAIEGPARRSGLRLEPGLVDLLVREVEGEPAALPMLSHVLRETWERREGPTLTVDGYRATGGIRRAVSQSAEVLYDAMDEPQRGRLRSLLLRLVMPTEDGDPVRARVPRAKVAVDEEHQWLVEQLVDARLVSIDGDTIQIAHEALVRVWPRLRGWLDDDVEGQRLFRHLASAADAWDTMGRPDSELYRGARLSRTLEWRDRTHAELSAPESAFLAASAALSESELLAARTRVVRERRVNRRLRGALAGVGVLLVLTLVAGVFAVRTADRAERERDRAASAAVLADARRAGAQALVHEDVATALLLAVNALQVDDSPQAWENLGAALTRAGPLAGVRNVGSQVGRDGDAYIVSMATSADGALVAASLPVDGVQLFDATTLAPVEFEEDIPSSAVAFSPDGRQLAMAVNQWKPEGGEPRVDPDPLRLYDMPSGELSEQQLGGIPSDRVVEYALAFSRDGGRLTTVLQHHLSGGRWARLGQATVWDLAHPSEPIFWEAVPEYALVSLSPDGDRLYVATRGTRPLRVYDVDSGRLIASAPSAAVASLGAAAVDVSPDGSTFVVASGGRIFQLDSSTLQPRVPALDGHSGGEVTDVSFSHDGRLLVSVATDGSAVVWDAHSGALLHRFVNQRSWFTGAAFGADDRTVYTTGADGFLQGWHLAGTHGLLALGEATEEAGPPYLMSLPAPDGQTVARLRSGRLWFENTATGRTTPPQPSEPVNFTWSPDSHWLLSSSADGVLRMWDARSGRLAAKATGIDVGTVLVPAFSNDSDKVYVATFTSIVTGTEGLWLETLDRATLRPLYDDVYLGPGTVVAIFPRPKDGSVVAVKEDGSFWYVQPEERDVLGSEGIGLLSAEERPAVLSPDGSLMVAPDPEQNLRLLDLDTRQWIGPDSDTLWGLDVEYAPDGSQFASVHPERIRLWDGHTGEFLASLPLPSATAEVTISYLPDSSGLLVASSDGRTWTVDTRTATWVRRACDIASRNLTREEWQQFFPNRPYEAACPQWPAGA